MIIQNGYIKFKIKVGGVYNEATGSYSKATEDWGDPIPCQWRATSSSLKGKSNGEAFVVAQYEILIALQDVAGERFQLLSLDEAVIGEYSPISIEPLQLVQITKILV